jgi:hypothetical protein
MARLRSFGVFAPVGYVIIAFPGDAEAAKARQALLTGGYEDDEIMTFTGQEVISDIESTRDKVSVLAYMGGSWTTRRCSSRPRSGARAFWSCTPPRNRRLPAS